MLIGYLPVCGLFAIGWFTPLVAALLFWVSFSDVLLLDYLVDALILLGVYDCWLVFLCWLLIDSMVFTWFGYFVNFGLLVLLLI